MTASTATATSNRSAVVHPGQYLQDHYLTAMGLSTIDAAAHLGVEEALLARLVAGEVDLTDDLALRLEGAVGGSVAEWLCRQARYSAHLLKRNVVLPMRQPLQSKYWGQDAGSFLQTAKVFENDTDRRCMVTLSFSATGEARFTLSALNNYADSELACSYEHMAAAALLRVVRGQVAQVDLLNADEPAYAHFQAKVLAGYRLAQAANQPTLQSISEAGRMRWFQHTPRDLNREYGADTVRPVRFTAGDAPTWDAEVSLRSVVSDTTSKALYTLTRKQ